MTSKRVESGVAVLKEKEGRKEGRKEHASGTCDEVTAVPEKMEDRVLNFLVVRYDLSCERRQGSGPGTSILLRVVHSSRPGSGTAPEVWPPGNVPDVILYFTNETDPSLPDVGGLELVEFPRISVYLPLATFETYWTLLTQGRPVGIECYIKAEKEVSEFRAYTDTYYGVPISDAG